MDVRTRVRGLTILALIVLIAGGVGAYYSVSRVNSLWQLRPAYEEWPEN